MKNVDVYSLWCFSYHPLAAVAVAGFDVILPPFFSFSLLLNIVISIFLLAMCPIGLLREI